MPVPSYKNTKKELVEIMRATHGDGRIFNIAKAILEIKTQEDMNKATWALVFVTVGLIVTSTVQVILTLKKC